MLSKRRNAHTNDIHKNVIMWLMQLLFSCVFYSSPILKTGLCGKWIILSFVSEWPSIRCPICPICDEKRLSWFPWVLAQCSRMTEKLFLSIPYKISFWFQFPFDTAQSVISVIIRGCRRSVWECFHDTRNVPRTSLCCYFTFLSDIVVFSRAKSNQFFLWKDCEWNMHVHEYMQDGMNSEWQKGL